MEPDSKKPFVPRLSRVISIFAALSLLAACSSTPPPSAPSGGKPMRTSTGNNAAQKLSQGTKLLMDSVSQPTAAFHFSYKAQKNINTKFPNDDKAKPEVGPVSVEADVAPDEISVVSNRGQKKAETTKAKKTDQLNWAMAQLAVTTTLMDPGFSLAFAGPVAKEAGSDTVGGAAADKYEFDSSTATGAAKAGMEIAMGMLGGKIKFTGVKGAAWLDHATGKMVKFNIDTDFADKAGDTWKEHDELEVTPK